MTPIEHNQTVYLISYLTVRRAVGILGMALPVILLLGTCLVNFPCPFQKSISDYYYTNMGSVFSGILCAVAIFLFTYKGFDNDKRFLQVLNDNRVTNIAAICALLVAFFPDGSIYTPTNIALPITKITVNVIHYSAASLLFFLLGAMSFVFFSAHAKDVTKQKEKRNRVYKACGIIIWISIAIIFFIQVSQWYGLKKPLVNTWIICYNKLIFESICLIAFGFSWLVKGETLWKDK